MGGSVSIRFSSLVLVTAAALALTGCAAAPRAVTPVNLSFGTWVYFSPEQEDFMKEVTARSDGTITFTRVEEWAQPDGIERLSDEQSMVKEIVAGNMDIGWTSNRSFPTLGIDGFRAMEAPFLVRNTAAQIDIATGPIGADALKAVSAVGLTGLAAYPGTLRYPLTNGAPLLQPSDWNGKDIAYYGDPSTDSVQARTIAALGGKPVFTGLHILDDLTAGAYAGGADSLSDIAQGGATPQGPYVTSNVVLWAPLLMTVMNSKKFASLDPSQQRVLLQVAQEEAKEVVDETVPVPGLGGAACTAGARFGTATPDQLADLRAAVQPVYDWLQSDPKEAPMLARMEKVAAAHPKIADVTVANGCEWVP